MSARAKAPGCRLMTEVFMPRRARLDAAGVLHHVIIRGINRKGIFLGNDDREDFAGRLSVLLPETVTVCYAWALMSNHAHMLLRTGDVPCPWKRKEAASVSSR